MSLGPIAFPIFCVGVGFLAFGTTGAVWGGVIWAGIITALHCFGK